MYALKTTSTESAFGHIILYRVYYTLCKQSFGKYIGIILSVHLSIFLVSTTPP